MIIVCFKAGLVAWGIRQLPSSPDQVVMLVDQNLERLQNDQDSLPLLVPVDQAVLLQKPERRLPIVSRLLLLQLQFFLLYSIYLTSPKNFF